MTTAAALPTHSAVERDHLEDDMAPTTAGANGGTTMRGALGLIETKGLVGAIEAADCLLYTSPSPRDRQKSRMPSSA